MDEVPRAADIRAACAVLGCFRCQGEGEGLEAIQRAGKWEMVMDDEGAPYSPPPVFATELCDA